MKKIFSLILILLMCTPLFALSGTAASTPSAAKVTVNNGYLNVRAKPTSSSAVVATLNKGGYVTVTEKSGNWWRVEYADGRYGYCHASYITAVSSSAATVRVSSGYLNVRSGAGTSYSRIAALNNGKSVTVLSQANGWSHILYNGTKTGYVSSKYLTLNSAYQPVSLSVPSFKQTDPRWSNVIIGNSGKTIGRIGCATTCLAMIESYTQEQSITPEKMMRSLSYTSGGSVYWPAKYTAHTDEADYLVHIYKQLQLGKPVLFGGKTSAGNQHWIVITGFVGGNSLHASGFTINDPGSSQRTNLSQFLSAYPYFYKYFTY